ncbi:MAG TPA: AMP-binding protein [Kofleriaceae bacterium]|nr:AMP-binding protein [Kofleriaceae bacterium]
MLLGGEARAPALVDRDEVWSYERLALAAEAAGAEMRAAGRLGFLFCRVDAATVVRWVGAIESGCAVALFDAALDRSARDALIDRYQPDWIAGLDAGFERRISTSNGDVHPELALLLSTSGTTGSPKLVRLARTAVEHNARAIAQALAITPEQRAIASLPFHYSYGLSVLDSHLVAGASIALVSDGMTSEGFWRTVRDARCTSMAGVPYSYQMLRRLDLEKLDVPSLRTLTQAGGRLDPRLVAHFADVQARRGGELYVMYGQTEATARIAVMPPSELREHLDAVGRAVPGGALSSVDGEIVYRGPNVMMGYATERAELARGDDLGGELATGDLGRVDESGLLYVTGRSRRIAKVFGLRVNLEELEGLARAHGPAAAIAGDDHVIVYCEAAPDADLAPRRAELAARLGVHPSGLVFRAIEQLPLAASGKIDYARLSSR